MKKQELIERIEGLKNLFGNKAEYIEIDAAIRLISELHEPQKPVVPQFVADWYEYNKDDFENALFRSIDLMPSTYEEGELSEFEEWLVDEHTKPFQILVNMHQFGYEVEKEKKYEVILCNGQSLKTVYRQGRDYLDFEKVYGDLEIFTRKQLEDAGFGWAFDCPGVDIEEVE